MNANEKPSLPVGIETINPVDFFSRYHVQEMFDMMKGVKSFKSYTINTLTYEINAEDSKKRTFTILENMFVVTDENGLNLPVGRKLSAFQMLQMFIFKDNFEGAVLHVMYEYMKIEIPYIRVGTNYFRVLVSMNERVLENQKSLFIEETEVVKWDKTTIVDDHGRGFLSRIPKYNSFTIEPDNKSFQPVINGKYNRYEKFKYMPLDQEEPISKDQFKWIDTMIKHIFQEQYDLGITYVKVLYDLPKQTLPILCLVSKENQTGKSTFTNFIQRLFGDNTVLANNQTISSGFNSSYATRNIMVIEEALMTKKQDAEKLKALSTQETISVNEKNVTEYNSPLYLKLIINSNNEKKFAIIEDSDIRYWVRKIPTLKGIANHNILEDMVSEIPAFLAYLNSLPDVDTSRSRMVFTEEEIRTDALKKIQKASQSSLHKDIKIYLQDLCDTTGEKELYFNPKMIKDMFFDRNSNYQINYIRDVLKDEMKLEYKRAIKQDIFQMQNKLNLPTKQRRLFCYVSDNLD